MVSHGWCRMEQNRGCSGGAERNPEVALRVRRLGPQHREEGPTFHADGRRRTIRHWSAVQRAVIGMQRERREDSRTIPRPLLGCVCSPKLDSRKPGGPRGRRHSAGDGSWTRGPGGRGRGAAVPGRTGAHAAGQARGGRGGECGVPPGPPRVTEPNRSHRRQMPRQNQDGRKPPCPRGTRGCVRPPPALGITAPTPAA